MKLVKRFGAFSWTEIGVLIAGAAVVAAVWGGVRYGGLLLLLAILSLGFGFVLGLVVVAMRSRLSAAKGGSEPGQVDCNTVLDNLLAIKNSEAVVVILQDAKLVDVFKVNSGGWQGVQAKFEYQAAVAEGWSSEGLPLERETVQGEQTATVYVPFEAEGDLLDRVGQVFEVSQSKMNGKVIEVVLTGETYSHTWRMTN